MGIPQFFSWLQRKYKGISNNSSPVDKYDYLYFDFNCLIYYAWRDLSHSSHAKLSKQTLEQRESTIIKAVIEYTRKIIFDIVKPTKYVFIGLDGTVPRAKMNQQRFRRYKSKKMKEYYSKIDAKYGIIKEELWDTNCITPGTIFMEKLSVALQ